MNIEENFDALIETLLALYKNTLLRSFFFNFLNIHYETTIYKAQQTYGKQKPLEQAKPRTNEEEKLNIKVDEALETAKKAWTGNKTQLAKKVPEEKIVGRAGRVFMHIFPNE